MKTRKFIALTSCFGMFALSGLAIAGSTQQSTGYIQESPSVYRNLGEFTIYLFQVKSNDQGYAVPPTVPVASGAGSCTFVNSFQGSAPYMSGMDGMPCSLNIYALNVKFSNGTWWTIINPKVVTGNIGPQAAVDGCAGTIGYAADGQTLTYSDGLGCIKQ